MMTRRIYLEAGLLLLVAANAVGMAGTIAGVVQHPHTRNYKTLVFLQEVESRSGTAQQRYDRLLRGGVALKERPVMDQINKTFVPHVLPILAGTTVEFRNSEGFEHNVNSPEGKYDLGTWVGEEIRSYTFRQPGVYTQLCNLHPEMIAYVVVLETSHFALAKRDGTFLIQNVPPGPWMLKVWNERFRPAELEEVFPIQVAPSGETSAEIAFGRDAKP